MAEHPTAPQDGARDGLDMSLFEAPVPRGTRSEELPGLHVCPACESQLVYPVDWSPAPRERWSVDLRCPDCEWHGGGVYTQDLVDRFDEELDAGCQLLLDDLQVLARANMEDQVARFLRALWADQVLPEDF